jgi:hypothetical protein
MTRLNGLSGAALSGLAGLVLFAAASTTAQAGPFSSFEGNWTGSGTVTVNNGTKERLRCRAHYNVGEGGATLEQNLTCASDSYKFNVVSNVRAQGGAITGSWSETSRGANGEISGRIGPTQISAQVEGPGFTARIGIAARGGRQSVTISPTGTDITNVSVTMSRG